MCGLDVLLLGLTMLALVIMLGEIIPSLCFSRNCFFMTVLKKTYQIFHWKTYKCDKSFLEKKNNGMINHSKCMHVHAQSCLTLCNPLCNYTPPETSVHGVFQTRNTGVDGHFLFQESSQTRNQTHVSCISCTGRRILYPCTTWEAHHSKRYH